jgi:hypothetical protein
MHGSLSQLMAEKTDVNQRLATRWVGIKTSGGSGTACFGREAREVRDMTSGLALLVKIVGDDRKAMCSIGQLQQSIKGGEVAKGRERDL